MKTGILISSIIILISVFGWYWFHQIRDYQIGTDEDSIEQAIENMLNTKTEATKQIEIRMIRDISNKKIVLFSVDEEIGDAMLTKGQNGKFKIENVGYGTNRVRERVMHTKEGNYYRAAGKKDNIGRIKAFISDQICDIPIPTEEYYIEVCKVGKRIEQSFSNAMLIYDIKENEIARINIPSDQIIN